MSMKPIIIAVYNPHLQNIQAVCYLYIFYLWQIQHIGTLFTTLG